MHIQGISNQFGVVERQPPARLPPVDLRATNADQWRRPPDRQLTPRQELAKGREVETIEPVVTVRTDHIPPPPYSSHLAFIVSAAITLNMTAAA